MVTIELEQLRQLQKSILSTKGVLAYVGTLYS
jgi:hypothetical protein